MRYLLSCYVCFVFQPLFVNLIVLWFFLTMESTFTRTALYKITHLYTPVVKTYAHRCISVLTSPHTLIFHRTGVNIMPRLQFPTWQRSWLWFAPHGSTGNRCRQRPRSSPAAGAGILRPLTNCARSHHPLKPTIWADSDKYARLTDKLEERACGSPSEGESGGHTWGRTVKLEGRPVLPNSLL